MLRQSAHLSKLQFLVVLFVLLFVAALLPAKPCQAGMHELADTDLAAVYGTGFSTFTWETVGSQSIAKAYFNIEGRMYADIDSLKMGYYDNGISTPPLGWDQNWTGVKLGTPTTDLVAKGFYIEAGFTDVNDAGLRQLTYVKIGTPDLKGKISGDFKSISGDITGPTVYSFARTNLGVATIEAIAPTVPGAPQGFYLSLDRTNGYLVHWDSATVTP